MLQQQAALVERLRAMLANQSSIREVSMFGGRAFMVNDKMIASALRDGDLLVRVAQERDGELVELPGATRAEMGTGRSMGPGWVSVSADSITNDERLSFWVGVALEHNHSAGKRQS
jgi:TfoX/Sxy family transcriptional regulator of competence genes